MPRFVLLCPQLKPRLRVLRPRTSYVLGRDPLADVQLPSDAVSRRHAELEWTMTNGFVVRDRKSTNGTRVNGVPVLQPRLLKDGDQLAIGPFRLAFREYHGDVSHLGDREDGGTITSGDLDELGQAPTAEAFGGNFDGQELLEICRLIAVNEKDGVLTVWGERVNGQLAFEKGEIRRARTGEGKGPDAAHAILAITHGRFEFAAGLSGLERNCRLKPEALIMEVARRLDQLTAADATATDLQAPSDPTQRTKRIALADVNPFFKDEDEPGKTGPDPDPAGA